MIELTYADNGYEPVEGDVVRVPQDRLGLLSGCSEGICFVRVASVTDVSGVVREPALTTLDLQKIPKPSELCRRPLELVADSRCWAGGAHLTVPWEWSSDFDLEVGLPDWAIVVQLDEPEIEHRAKAVQRRVNASVAFAFFYVAVGRELWRLGHRGHRTVCIQEAEVFLDKVREETDDYGVFHGIAAGVRLYRGWPGFNSLADAELMRLRSIISCACQGGKAAGSRKGLNKDSWNAPTSMAIPSWDIEPLRSIIFNGC